jgi:large subunit ribosomal protein L25
MLETPLHEIEVECLPKDLPERIEIDIADLKVNHSIHVRDIPLAQGVRLLSNPDQVVALVKFAKIEVVATPEVEAAATDAAAGAAAAPGAAPAAGAPGAAPGAAPASGAAPAPGKKAGGDKK